MYEDQFINEAPPIPEFFKRELAVIDKSYYCIWHPKWKYWIIKKKMGWTAEMEDGTFKPIRDPWLATFTELSAVALDNLRKRKRDGEKFKGDIMKYYKFHLDQHNEEKKKRIHANREMMAEGYIRMFSIGKKKVFDQGGSR